MRTDPKRLEALARILTDCPQLANGWFGREISDAVGAEDPTFVDAQHQRRFLGFQRRLHRKFDHLFIVERSPIYQDITIWAWWACGFHDLIPSWWLELFPHEHSAMMDISAPLIREKSIHRIPLLRLMQDSGNLIFQKTGK